EPRRPRRWPTRRRARRMRGVRAVSRVRRSHIAAHASPASRRCYLERVRVVVFVVAAPALFTRDRAPVGAPCECASDSARRMRIADRVRAANEPQLAAYARVHTCFVRAGTGEGLVENGTLRVDASRSDRVAAARAAHFALHALEGVPLPSATATNTLA